MHQKQLFGIDDGFNSHNFPSNFKRRKFDAVRKFPVNCGTSVSVTVMSDTTCPKPDAVANSTSNCQSNACNNSTSNIKRPKVEVSRDFPEHYGPFASGSSGGRTVPTIQLESIPERSVPVHGKNYDVRQEVEKNENKVCSQEELWDRDLAKLRALIIEAEAYINVSGVKGKQTFGREPRSLVETAKQEKHLSEKTTKVKDKVSDAVQGKATSGLKRRWEDCEKEVPILSPVERNMLQTCVKHDYESVKSSLVLKSGEKTEKWSSHKVTRGYSDVLHSQGIKIIGTKSNQQSEGNSYCELIENARVEKLRKHCSLNLDEYASDLSSTMVDSKDLLKYSESEKKLINLRIVSCEQPQGFKVMEALKMFQEQYTKVLQDNNSDAKNGKGAKYPHLEAAERVKAQGMWIYTERPFGHIPGIEIGHEFRFRTELAIIGLHRHLVSGIDYVVLDGKKFATSIVNSGRYENNAKELDVLIYCGQGGNPKTSKKAAYQRLEKGNLALVNSMEMRCPVRVTYKRKRSEASKGSNSEGDVVYVYDGLYMVNKFWDEIDQNNKLIYKFELHRMPGQPRSQQTDAKPRQPIMCPKICRVDDVSQGEDNHPIRATNGVDDHRPLPFIYVTHIVYPHWCQCIDPIGSNCINSCSSSQKCPCVLKNAGEIPFNKNGAIVRAKPIVHSFICVYNVELLRDKEAKERIGDEEYLFDMSGGRHEGVLGTFEGFLDSKSNYDRFIMILQCRRILRDINHSCSPNLYHKRFFTIIMTRVPPRRING
ncbi:Histone-lysine N-methyltransferase [Handroanthus impetiginosus]|uniref:Histone-lysine N-methyltransferase n=1 Tax=Handroanthus impetiginosus TaxID=429701 RepID=A0A2G9HYL4_9LAMI|nr:Histone-lysine N-methyltransferase [Handroanthus impetiginosus]